MPSDGEKERMGGEKETRLRNPPAHKSTAGEQAPVTVRQAHRKRAFVYLPRSSNTKRPEELIFKYPRLESAAISLVS
jgi:hypothetical protein